MLTTVAHHATLAIWIAVITSLVLVTRFSKTPSRPPDTVPWAPMKPRPGEWWVPLANGGWRCGECCGEETVPVGYTGRERRCPNCHGKPWR